MVVWKAMDKAKFFSNIQIIHLLGNWQDQGVDCYIRRLREIERFKKRNSSKYYVENYDIMLYTSQDPGRRFYISQLYCGLVIV